MRWDFDNSTAGEDREEIERLEDVEDSLRQQVRELTRDRDMSRATLNRQGDALAQTIRERDEARGDAKRAMNLRESALDDIETLMKERDEARQASQPVGMSRADCLAQAEEYARAAEKLTTDTQACAAMVHAWVALANAKGRD